MDLQEVLVFTHLQRRIVIKLPESVKVKGKDVFWTNFFLTCYNFRTEIIICHNQRTTSSFVTICATLSN